MSRTADIAELVKISGWAGNDVLLVQGGGGNTSVKSSNGLRMYIKASGFRLSEVTHMQGYVETDLPALVSLMQDPAPLILSPEKAQEWSVQRIQAATLNKDKIRPSLETCFHALLEKVVLHIHPVYVNAFACMKGGPEAFAEVVKAPTAWVSFTPPGYTLGLQVSRICRASGLSPDPPVRRIILENHGLIVSGLRCHEVKAAAQELIQSGEAYFGSLDLESLNQMHPTGELVSWTDGLAQSLRGAPRPYMVRIAGRAAICQAALNPEKWLTQGPLVPDDVVYLGSGVWRAESFQTPKLWLNTLAEPLPSKFCVVVAGLGVILVGPSNKILSAMEETLLAHVLIRRLIARRGKARNLPPADIDYLLSMESEKFRQAVAATAT